MSLFDVLSFTDWNNDAIPRNISADIIVENVNFETRGRWGLGGIFRRLRRIEGLGGDDMDDSDVDSSLSDDDDDTEADDISDIGEEAGR